MCPLDDRNEDPDFVAHAPVPEEEAAGGKRKRSKKDSIPNKRRKLSEEHQLGKSSKRNKLEPPEESGMSSVLTKILHSGATRGSKSATGATQAPGQCILC